MFWKHCLLCFIHQKTLIFDGCYWMLYLAQWSSWPCFYKWWAVTHSQSQCNFPNLYNHYYSYGGLADSTVLLLFFPTMYFQRQFPGTCFGRFLKIKFKCWDFQKKNFFTKIQKPKVALDACSCNLCLEFPPVSSLSFCRVASHTKPFPTNG